MHFYIYLILTIIFILLLNKYFISKKILVSETGDIHQKFASKLKIPLTGGIFLFIASLFFIKENLLIFYCFTLGMLVLGVFSDLKFIKSAKIRLFFQILIVFIFIIIIDLKILDTRIYFINSILSYNMVNYIFVCFCVLIVINGSNFLDGLNTLNIGYYILISLVIFYLNLNQDISVNNFPLNMFIISLLSIYILNFLNKLYLGDSGSYLLGFVFSILLIKLYETNNQLSPFFIILLLWYPSYENLFSMIRKNIFKKSAMQPDSKHLHQLTFFYIKKEWCHNIFKANLISANIINLYNLLIFLVSFKFYNSSEIQIFLIILNLIIYTVTYLKLLFYRYRIKI